MNIIDRIGRVPNWVNLAFSAINFTMFVLNLAVGNYKMAALSWFCSAFCGAVWYIRRNG
jgi:hypothetical protein